jgi:hypothetical protein
MPASGDESRCDRCAFAAATTAARAYFEFPQPAPHDSSRSEKEHYSGKKRTHSDMNLVLVNETSGTFVYLSPKVTGTTQGKK